MGPRMRSGQRRICFYFLLFVLSSSVAEALLFPRREAGDRRFGFMRFGRRQEEAAEEESATPDVLTGITFDPALHSRGGYAATPTVPVTETKQRSLDEELLLPQSIAGVEVEQETKPDVETKPIIKADVSALLGPTDEVKPIEEVEQEAEEATMPYWMEPPPKSKPGTNVPKTKTEDAAEVAMLLHIKPSTVTEEPETEVQKASVLTGVHLPPSETTQLSTADDPFSVEAEVDVKLPGVTTAGGSEATEAEKTVAEEGSMYSKEAALTGESTQLDSEAKHSIFESVAYPGATSPPSVPATPVKSSATEEKTTKSELLGSAGVLVEDAKTGEPDSPSPSPKTGLESLGPLHFSLEPTEAAQPQPQASPSPSAPRDPVPSPSLTLTVPPLSPIAPVSPSPEPVLPPVLPPVDPPASEPAAPASVESPESSIAPTSDGPPIPEPSSSPSEPGPSVSPTIPSESGPPSDPAPSPSIPPVSSPLSLPPISPHEPSPSPPSPSISPTEPSPSPPSPSISPTEPSPSPPSPSISPTEPSPSPLSPLDIHSPADLVAVLEAQGKDLTGVRTGVELPEGKVGMLFEEGSKVELQDIAIGPMEDVDILLKVSGGDVTLRGVTIGGPVEPPEPTRVLKDTASFKTGLDIGNGKTVTVVDTIFQGATETMVKANEGSTFECTRCTFKDNTGIEGGAIRATDSTVKLQSCELVSNRATTGGAIHYEGNSCAINSDAKLQLVDSVFEGNRASSSGASVFVQCGNAVRITGSSFRSGKAARGGAIHTANLRMLEVENTQFTNNEAEKSGGALWTDKIETVTVLSSSFRKNAALEAGGGAIYLTTCADATVRNTGFYKNYAVDGGALKTLAHYASPSKLFLESNVFESNKVSGSGGAVLIQRQIEPQSEIKEASIETVYVGMARSNFHKNSAGRGGAVFVSSESQTDHNIKIAVRGTNFTQNKAEEVGGGVYCGDHAIMTVFYSLFQENEAEQGVNCARFCGCRVTMSNSKSVDGNEDTNSWVQDLCPTDKISSDGSSSSGSGAMVYAYVAVAAMVAFIIMAVIIVAKKRRRVSRHLSHRGIQRTLTEFVGPDRTSSILSAPFLEGEGDDDELRRGGPSLVRSSTFGEMDYYVPEGHEHHAESVDHNMFAGEEETAALAQTLSADDAFIDCLYDEEELQRTGLQSPLAAIPETGSHP